MCPLRMETPPLRVGDVPFSDGNAAAQTSALFIAGKVLADGQKRKTHPEMRISGVGFRLNMLRKWLSWRLDCEILHFFIIFAAEKIKPI